MYHAEYDDYLMCEPESCGKYTIGQQVHYYGNENLTELHKNLGTELNRLSEDGYVRVVIIDIGCRFQYVLKEYGYWWGYPKLTAEWERWARKKYKALKEKEN